MAARFLPITVLIVVLVVVLHMTLREFFGPLTLLGEEEKRQQALAKRLQAHLVRLEAQQQMFGGCFSAT